MLVARTGYTGEDGFEFYIAPDAAPALWEAIAETGAGSGLVPAGLAARDTLRLEAGMPLYGHELGTDTFPVQAGLGRVVALKTKEGDFVGRAGRRGGPAADARVLVGLVSDGKRAGRAGYAGAATATRVVGEITRGALSPDPRLPDRHGLRRPRARRARHRARTRRARHPRPRIRRPPPLLQERVRLMSSNPPPT